MKRGIDETELLRRLAELPRELRPQHDPWSEIAARIGPAARESAPAGAPKSAWVPARRRALPMLAAAASLVAALAVGWMLAPRWAAETAAPTDLVQTQPPTAEEPSATQPLPEAPVALPVAVAASEAEYLAAFREFIPVGSSARPDLSPRTLATIESGWSDLRTAEQNLVAALERDPEDPFLNDRMLELRARQLGFLQKLATLDMENRRLTI